MFGPGQPRGIGGRRDFQIPTGCHRRFEIEPGHAGQAAIRQFIGIKALRLEILDEGFSRDIDRFHRTVDSRGIDQAPEPLRRALPGFRLLRLLRDFGQPSRFILGPLRRRHPLIQRLDRHACHFERRGCEFAQSLKQNVAEVQLLASRKLPTRFARRTHRGLRHRLQQHVAKPRLGQRLPRHATR